MIFYLQRTDGKSGNITVIRLLPNTMLTLTSGFEIGPIDMFEGISDYGNKVKWATSNLHKQFYSTFGKATPGHKYYNYYETYPEELV